MSEKLEVTSEWLSKWLSEKFPEDESRIDAVLVEVVNGDSVTGAVQSVILPNTQSINGL